MSLKFVMMAGGLLVGGAVQAQERSAGGSLDMQMTWSALKTIVDGANAKSDAAHQRIDRIIACSKRGMAYVPTDEAETTGDGCVGYGTMKVDFGNCTTWEITRSKPDGGTPVMPGPAGGWICDADQILVNATTNGGDWGGNDYAKCCKFTQ